MKKSELQRIIKEEVQKFLKEDTAQELTQLSDRELINMAEDDGMEEMIVLDGEGGLANRDELIQALATTNEGNVFPMWEAEDNELNESIKHFQKLAGIITEEYGVSKEAKSNDYYKKGMMSQQAETYDMNTTAPDSTGMRTKWDYETFKKEIEIMAPDSGVKQDNEGNIIVMLKQSRWYNPKHFKQLIKNYSNFIDPNPVPYTNENGFKGIMFKKKR